MFRWNPEDYLQHSGEQEKWAKKLIPKIGLKGDERALDIGCGWKSNGRDSTFLHRWYRPGQQALRPGGRAVLQMGGEGNAARPGTEASWPRRVEMIPRGMTRNGREGLAGWIRTTWLPYVQRVPVEMQDRFISDVVSGYEQCHPPQDGLFHVAMTRLEVEAVREQ